MKILKIKDNLVFNVIFITAITFLIEIIFRLVSNFAIIDYATLRIFISNFALAIIISFLSHITKKRWLKVTINLVYILLYSIYVWLQIGFINYLGVYLSFHTSSQFGAVKDYIWDYLASFKWSYYLVFLPFVIYILFYILFSRKMKYHNHKIGFKSLFLLVFLISSIFVYYLTITLPFMQNNIQIKSNKALIVNPDVPTVAVNQFGPIVFGLADFKTFIFPIAEEIEEESYNNEPVIKKEEKTRREVSGFLEDIALSETNQKYSSLNKFFASRNIDDYNDYTGMFKDKNVVVILMESVNEAMINEEYFPNYTKLYKAGWHWVNNYSPRNSCATGNNEFSTLTSLYSIYNTCTSNVYKNNTYFESLFGLFNDNNYRTLSFHDFLDWYYYRHSIHPNMGSSKYYGSKELDIKTKGTYGEWPSDIEFFEKAFDIILNDEDDRNFLAFLTTVTSHQPYSTSSTYGDLHKDYFKSEGYSTHVSRYLSKLKVVDDAIGVMIEKLEEKNELENTVIVILADHYPYGLNKSQVKEMLDYNLEDYDIEKTPLLIYNPEMQPQEFTQYSSYINILPTIANLAGLNYDPRLYMGSDLLSKDYNSRVVFADGSWKNEKAYYNASTSRIKYYTDIELTPEEIKNINSEIRMQIDMSSKAIKSNYFNYLKKKLDEYNKEQETKVIEEEMTEVNNEEENNNN